MVSIKEATQNAMRFATESLGDERASDLRLEELESETIEGEDYWLITLSIPDPTQAGGSLNKLLNDARGKREYKIFNVSKDTGEVTAMKIRMIGVR